MNGDAAKQALVLRKLPSNDLYCISSFLETEGNTFVSARSKCSCVTKIYLPLGYLSITSLMAHSYASLTKADKSAPEKPSQESL